MNRILRRCGAAIVWAGLVGAAGSSCSSLYESPAYDPNGLAPAAPAAPWRPPAGVTSPPAFAPETAPDPTKVYSLPDLIDLALHANPDTRIAWEQARAAAARVGFADSAYFPVLAVAAFGGYARVENRTAEGPVYTNGAALTPQLTLQWTLLDFGRRDAEFDRAMQQLLQQNLQFDRTLQKVSYAVQQNFYRYDASRAQVEAALATLKSAASVEEAADARLAHGLATQTEDLLARQERARAQFEVQTAERAVADSESALADSMGISPATPVRVAELSDQKLPTGLSESVDEAMDRALAARPDLAARLAELRARDAELRAAHSNFLPTVWFSGSVGGTGGYFTAEGTDRNFDYVEPIYGAFLQFSWTLFDGYARENTVREAEARRGEAEAQLTQLQLLTLRQVWKSYADVKVALLQYDYAKALLAASTDAYDSALESYTAGLADIVELLAAERDLARARSTMIDSRAELLRSSAALAFAIGDTQN